MTPARRIAILAAAFVALVGILVLARYGEVGLWDWDTYGRLQFIHDYQPDKYVDGHLLYHGVMRVLMAVGCRDATAMAVETAIGASAFICLLVWICRREGLSTASTSIVVAAATIGSPGVIALFVLAEDNVLYLPLALGAFYLLYLRHADRRSALLRGVVLGVVLAAAMLINISLLVIVLALITAAVVVALVGDRTRALGLCVAVGTAIALYYLAHVVPFTGAKVALHEFLPKALGLQDFHLSTTPLVSLERFAEYRGGLRAMALTPNLHLMSAPPGLRAALVGPLTVILALLAVVLCVWCVRYRRAELLGGLRTRLDLLAVYGVSVVFPYVYEPYLIERWDLFWVGYLFALVPLLAAKPSRFARGLVVAMIAVQSIGSIVTVAHHYGAAWVDPGIARARSIATEIIARDSEVVVLPFSENRLITADLVYRIGLRPIVYLVRDDGVCIRLFHLTEVTVEVSEVLQALRSGKRVYVDAALSPERRRAVGL